MTTSEIFACSELDSVKVKVKQALIMLDPGPADPVAVELLAILDAVDVTKRKIAARAARFEGRK